MKYLFYTLIALLAISCSTKTSQIKLIDSSSFSTEIDGKKVDLYTLKNKNGMVTQITNLGGRIVSVWVPDAKGNFGDVVLGFNTAKEYSDASVGFYGAIIGRYGNRIGKGTFTIDSVKYQLSCNNGENSLHGGPTGFYTRVWDAKQIGENKLELTYVSKDMEEGYPGNLKVKVTYELTDDNAIKINYEATTDKTTTVNLTNHSYFNLSGEASGSINDDILFIDANNITPVSESLIPTGELMPVKDTPFDFTTPTVIGKRVSEDNEQLKFANGYDHNFVLNKNGDELKLAAKVKDPKSGRILEVITNEPGIQFYGGNFMAGVDKGKYGHTFNFREAFCLETQHFPDSPNHPNFPSTLLEPGQTYHSTCIYKFSAE